MGTLMEYKGYKAQIMEAPRLEGDGVHGLPPGTPLEVYHSEAFEKYPEAWMRGPGVFVVPVRSPDKGLWFNWTDNSWANTAVIPTVKGCNPITGLPTTGFHLEKYEEKCPKHGIAFQGDRYCPDCGYRWLPMNYVAYPNVLWWDTWAIGGDVGRQFFFTEEMARDIATAMIGPEQTVPAFGFAFYSPKQLRPEVGGDRKFYNKMNTEAYPTGSSKSWSLLSHSGLYVLPDTYCSTLPPPDMSSQTIGFDAGVTKGSNSADSTHAQVYYTASAAPAADAPKESLKAMKADRLMRKMSTKGLTRLVDIDNEWRGRRDDLQVHTVSDGEEKTSGGIISSGKLVPDGSRGMEIPKEIKEVAVGAGSRIQQTLIQDPYSLESWKDKPDCVMTIYFVFQPKFEELKAGGLRDLSGKPEGMLQGLPVG